MRKTELIIGEIESQLKQIKKEVQEDKLVMAKIKCDLLNHLVYDLRNEFIETEIEKP